MAEIVEKEWGAKESGRHDQGALGTGITVNLGMGDVRIQPFEAGTSIAALLAVVAVERSCAAEDLVMFRDGEEEALTELIIIDSRYPHHHRHHVHFKGPVKVTVYYEAKHHHREFKRSATLENVLDWAIKTFNIDPSMAGEFELARHGEKEELPSGEHVGHVAGRHHELELDLVRNQMSNG